MKCTLPVWRLCLLLLPLATGVAYSDELSSEAVYQKALPSVMTLQVEGKSGDKRLGTAVLVLKDGLAATAWHLVTDAKTVTAKFSDGESFDVSGLVDKDEKRDVAIVRVKVFGRPILPLVSDTPAVGSKAYVIGAPKGLEFSISDGLVSQVQLMDGVKYYQFSCAASPGNSGGPLVDAKGQVVGIVSWQVRDGQNLNFAIPSTYVLGLDSTLPTQPWDQVKHAEPAADTTADMSAESVDAMLAKALCLDSDARVALMYTFDLLSKPVYKDNFLNVRKYTIPDVPQCLYDITEASKPVLSRLGSVKSDDFRGRMARHEEANMTVMLEVIDLCTKTIKVIQRQSGWTPEAKDLIAQAYAKRPPSESLSEADWKSLAESKTFVDSLPIDMQFIIPGHPDDTGFRLGVSMFSTTPMTLQTVPKESLAYSLGLRQGDTVTTVDDLTPRSWIDVKRALKARLGQKCKVAVVRSGKAQVLDVRLPKELPKDALLPTEPK